MDHRRTSLIIALALLVALCLAAGSVQAKGKKPPTQDTVVRADFRDAGGDRITSDDVGLWPPCHELFYDGELYYDYVDRDDPCYDGVDPQATISHRDYLLRTVTTNLATQPVRWLVLDFSEGEPVDLLQPDGDWWRCRNLDWQLSSGNPDYPGRRAEVESPLNGDLCVDFLEVRFWAYGPFEPSAQDTEVHLVIDGPDLVGGKGKNAEDYTQWNAKFYLDFINPLTVTLHPGDSNTRTIGEDGRDDFRAELWTVNQKNGRREDLLGIYNMPFQLTVTRVPQD